VVADDAAAANAISWAVYGDGPAESTQPDKALTTEAVTAIIRDNPFIRPSLSRRSEASLASDLAAHESL
jgi:hypothetical protein